MLATMAIARGLLDVPQHDDRARQLQILSASWWLGSMIVVLKCVPHAVGVLGEQYVVRCRHTHNRISINRRCKRAPGGATKRRPCRRSAVCPRANGGTAFGLAAWCNPRVCATFHLLSLLWYRMSPSAYRVSCLEETTLSGSFFTQHPFALCWRMSNTRTSLSFWVFPFYCKPS